MRSRSKVPVLQIIVILILCVTESARGLSFSFLFGGSFIGQKVIIHTPPERGFIDRDKSVTHSQETPVKNTDLITSYTRRLGT